MRKLLLNFAAMGMLLGAPMLAGCDRTIEEDTTVKQKSDGSTEVKREKVTESPDGTITKTEEHKVDR